MIGAVSDESEQLEPALVDLFKISDEWRRRASQPTPDPAAGSSLLEDDRATGMYAMSHAVVSSLGSAVDDFHAVGALLVNARMIHTSAPFTLLRAALENAATAVYLLAPKDRPTRIERRLKLQWADYLDAEKAREVMGQDDAARQRARNQKLQDTARSAGLPKRTVESLLARPPGYAAIIEEAGKTAFGPHGAIATVTWMADSGIAHGRTWANLAVFERQEYESARNGFAAVRLSSSQRRIFQHAQITAAMIKLGWRLLDLSATPPN
jgi:hypothetical protein